MSRSGKIFLLRLLLTGFIVAGVWIGTYATSELRVAVDALDWPTTQGTITKSVVIGAGSSRRHLLRYVYRVDGRPFSGHRATLADGIIRHRTKERARLYPEGQNVTVYYSPAQPSNAVLQTGIYWPGVIFYYVAALILATVGAGALYVTRR